MSDLIFESRVRAHAESLGVPFRAVRSLDRLTEVLDQGPWALVVVDMEVTGDIGPEAVATARCHESSAKVVAYMPHVAEHLSDAALEAGADLVLPRWDFNDQLSDLLQESTTRRAETD